MHSQRDMPRLAVGLVHAISGVLMQVFGDVPTAGVVGIVVLGLVSIGTASNRARP